MYNLQQTPKTVVSEYRAKLAASEGDARVCVCIRVNTLTNIYHSLSACIIYVCVFMYVCLPRGMF